MAPIGAGKKSELEAARHAGKTIHRGFGGLQGELAVTNRMLSTARAVRSQSDANRPMRRVRYSADQSRNDSET